MRKRWFWPSLIIAIPLLLVLLTAVACGGGEEDTPVPTCNLTADGGSAHEYPCTGRAGADRQAGRAGYCDSSAHSHFSGASAYGCSDPARARTYVYTHSYSSAHGDASVRHDASGAVRP